MGSKIVIIVVCYDMDSFFFCSTQETCKYPHVRECLGVPLVLVLHVCSKRSSLHNELGLMA